MSFALIPTVRLLLLSFAQITILPSPSIRILHPIASNMCNVIVSLVSPSSATIFSVVIGDVPSTYTGAGMQSLSRFLICFAPLPAGA